MRQRLVQRLSVAILSVIGIAASACTALVRVPASPPTSPELVGRRLSRGDALADLDTLVRVLDDVHPDLYATRSRDAFEADRRALVAALPDSLSRIDWWLRVAPLVASLGDGHTSLAPPGDELRQGSYRSAPLFAPSVTIDESGHMNVVAAFGERGIFAGDRVVTINGHDADSLARDWMRYFSGESDVYRMTQVSGGFRDQLIMHGITAPFSVVLEDSAGERRSVALPGMPRDSLAARLNRGHRGNGSAAQQNVSRTGPRGFTYARLEPGIGYMDFRSMSVDLGQFKSDVARMFAQVSSDSDHTLIIDLRDNGGGDSRVGDELLRYITSKPYRLDSRKDWKMSDEYRDFLKTTLSPPVRWALPALYVYPLAREMFTGPRGKIVTLESPVTTPSPAQPFFAGSVCMLIGPRTFSSAVDFADGVKTYHLATLVGEETGGRPNGFGEVYQFVLPRSGLRGSVSSARFVRASGDTSDHRGVLPDIPVTQTASDRRSGRDPVLEEAKTCPRRGTMSH